jgi:hypothetical protein
MDALNCTAEQYQPYTTLPQCVMSLSAIATVNLHLTAKLLDCEHKPAYLR